MQEPARLILLLGVAATVAGCRRDITQPPTPSSRSGSDRLVIANGVMYRRVVWERTQIHLIDVSLRSHAVRMSVLSGPIRPDLSPAAGEARTAAEWCAETGAVAAVNGGFFGNTVGDCAEIVGLLARGGRVLAGARLRKGTHGPYVRSVFGIDRNGMPGIRWATGRRGKPAALRVFLEPDSDKPAGVWEVRDAVGCGPTLVHRGRVRITDRSERLVSKGRLPRTFIAYGVVRGIPNRIILVAAEAMEYRDAAAFSMAYFAGVAGEHCYAAMCLDGGGSTQLAYRFKREIRMPMGWFTRVPTALAVQMGPASAEPSGGSGAQ